MMMMEREKERGKRKTSRKPEKTVRNTRGRNTHTEAEERRDGEQDERTHNKRSSSSSSSFLSSGPVLVFGTASSEVRGLPSEMYLGKETPRRRRRPTTTTTRRVKQTKVDNVDENPDDDDDNYTTRSRQ